jgi:penicillin amidase
VALDVVGGPAGLGVPEQTREREALDLWLAWDGYADRRSAGAAIGLVTARNIGRELVARLAGDEAAMAWAELAAFTGGTVLELGRMAARLRELGVDPAEVVRTAFARTLLICREAMGEEPAAWNWGALHPLVCRHRLDATMLGPFFAIGPEPADGGPDTVNRGDMGANRLDVKVGPAMRLVLSARDPDAAGCILPGGQSGDRLSPHYDDQLADFLAGRLKPMVSSRARIEVAVREVLLPPGTPAEALPAAARAAQAGHH